MVTLGFGQDIGKATGIGPTGRETALVTGAAQGIGAAVARLFAQEGAQDILCDILPSGQEIADAIGSAARFEPLDISDEGAWIDVVGRTEPGLGGIDILVNNAGIVAAELLVEFSREDFARVVEVNLVGTFLAIKHVGGAMARRGRGAIVNVSSNQGLSASNAMAAYASSKWGMRGLARVAALELGLSGVRVNSVFPGPVNTPMGNPMDMSEDEINGHLTFMRQPIQRIAKPDEIAQACLFLASDEASYIAGAELAVNGGMTIGQYAEFMPGVPTPKSEQR